MCVKEKKTPFCRIFGVVGRGMGLEPYELPWLFTVKSLIKPTETVLFLL